MKRSLLKSLVGGIALGLALPAGAALADDSIYVPLFTYRTGPFAGSGTPIADGMHDYLAMLNARDGGIGGVKLVVDECETGYDTKKGLECYDSVKPKNPVLVNPWSTGITLSLIPKAAVDKIPILSMAYGLSASAKGDVFPWVFNPPATYWDGLSEILKSAGGGSIEGLKGKTVGYLYFDAGFGKEPIPLFQTLAKEIGFSLKLYPVAAADMQNQSSKWLDIRRDKPDLLVMYGWGAMNPTAIKEAVKAEFPMDKFISIWWPNDADVAAAGDGAKGFRELNWHATGANFPALADIQKLVIGTGQSQTPKDEVGSVLYNRGVYNSVLIAEAIARAQAITGKKAVTGEDVRRGLENLDLDAARFKALGLENFAGPLKTTCLDHNSHSATFVQQWDGAKWVKASDPIGPDTARVRPLLDEAAANYAQKNAWPVRSEVCDNK
ncbi:amino acid/amide ABC transporter substrate-binding protein (HAAT family) [Roseiarcus fermentans]|uniref:Amino acid/amide ABC transporter substrate-binding protein (HAAT family) n=1 Tax=Roseiarcus fermentans TaxID=1473586 RepID=A0A366FR45_9HYPH|nr:ABC transporter substrate-binding protein [Roseiarcus fermentans]RBP16199.1 amino acid/amide ABC transporter substrate-binding protein (HAAT family) [Roseiarcus fermentans]